MVYSNFGKKLSFEKATAGVVGRAHRFTRAGNDRINGGTQRSADNFIQSEGRNMGEKQADAMGTSEERSKEF